MLAAIQEAVDIRRRLTAVRPDVFLSGLASSLGARSNVLASLNLSAEVAELAGEGLRIAVSLVERHPQAYGQLAHTLRVDLLKHSNAAGVQPDIMLMERVTRALSQTSA